MKLDSEGAGATIAGSEAGRIPGLPLTFLPHLGGNFWIEGNDNINSAETTGHLYVALCVY